MPDIKLDDAEGFYSWARMLVVNEDSYFFHEVQTSLNFYNHDDSAYLVMDVYTDEVNFTQYVFVAAADSDDDKVTFLIFDFLKTVNFSLKNLLNWLTNAPFQETEAGVRVTTCGLHICRAQPKSKPKRTNNVSQK